MTIPAWAIPFLVVASRSERGTPSTIPPLNPTPAMIEAGAQRLVRWETGNEKWPESWSKMDVRASRNDAERVWRSMWLEAHSIPPDATEAPPVPPNHKPVA